MSRLTLHVREWLADRSMLQYPRPRVRPVTIKAAPEFRFSDFVIAMQALGLASVCLLVAIPLLALCGLMVYALFVAL